MCPGAGQSRAVRDGKGRRGRGHGRVPESEGAIVLCSISRVGDQFHHSGRPDGAVVPLVAPLRYATVITSDYEAASQGS